MLFQQHLLQRFKMIKSKSEMPARPIEIDLTGPDGNAYALMAIARDLGRQLGYSQQRIDAIHKVMMLTNYEGLLHTFDVEFGHLVTMYR